MIRYVVGVYDSARLARGYAFDRPPVHERLLATAASGRNGGRGLDIGCGAGRSTAALAPHVDAVVGVEPVAAMLAHSRSVAPGASFVVGSAEALPFAPASFDVVSAAGSLNYTDIPVALAQVARVLAVGGTFLLYDFAEGRHARESAALAAWFAEFERRFPWPPGWRPVVVPELPFAAAGLRLLDYRPLAVELPMTLAGYLRFALSEVNVDTAIARGRATGDEVRDWCRESLAEVFGDAALTVVFPGYLATVGHAAVPPEERG